MFEEILNNHLRKCSDITSYLTKYDDEPAIFNQTAPDDMSDLWNDNVQYGRIVFFANMQSDTERKILSLASSHNDEVTVAMMSDYLKEQEKMVWMLTAYNG